MKKLYLDPDDTIREFARDTGSPCGDVFKEIARRMVDMINSAHEEGYKKGFEEGYRCAYPYPDEVDD